MKQTITISPNETSRLVATLNEKNTHPNKPTTKLRRNKIANKNKKFNVNVRLVFLSFFLFFNFYRATCFLRWLWYRRKQYLIWKSLFRYSACIRHQYKWRHKFVQGFCTHLDFWAGLHDNVLADLPPRWQKVRRFRVTQPRCTDVPD